MHEDDEQAIEVLIEKTLSHVEARFQRVQDLSKRALRRDPSRWRSYTTYGDWRRACEYRSNVGAIAISLPRPIHASKPQGA